jgi:hypothetical protein
MFRLTGDSQWTLQKKIFKLIKKKRKLTEVNKDLHLVDEDI